MTETIQHDGGFTVKRLEKGKREAALEAALKVMTGHDEVVEGKPVRVPPPASVLAMVPEYRELAVSMLIGLIQFETMQREGVERTEEQDEADTQRRRAFHVELARLKLPAEVLRALRGL